MTEQTEVTRLVRRMDDAIDRAFAVGDRASAALLSSSKAKVLYAQAQVRQAEAKVAALKAELKELNDERRTARGFRGAWARTANNMAAIERDAKPQNGTPSR